MALQAPPVGRPHVRLAKSNPELKHPTAKTKLSETSAAIRPERIEYIERRWRQLADAANSRLDMAVTYLMITNAGGAVATLSFMGAMKTVAPIPGAQLMLGLFLAGICLVGLLRAIHYYRFIALSNAWSADVASYYKDEIGWADMLTRDDARSGRFVLADVVGWLALACFFAGAGLGYAGMFEFGGGS